MQCLQLNRLCVVACMTMLVLIGFGCGGDDPSPPATDISSQPPGPSDSSIGTTDTTNPPEDVTVPDNLPEDERDAATAVLELGGHIDQQSSGHVQAVDLTGTEVADADLEQLAAFTKLQGLILTDTGISDDGLLHVASLPALTTLELYRTPISNEGLKHLAHVRGLAGLYLKGTSITDEGLAHIAGLENLTLVSLSNTALTDKGLLHLSGLSKLESLIIEDTKVTADGVIENLSGLKKLELISAAGTQISIETVQAIREAMPTVRVTGP